MYGPEERQQKQAERPAPVRPPAPDIHGLEPLDDGACLDVLVVLMQVVCIRERGWGGGGRAGGSRGGGGSGEGGGAKVRGEEFLLAHDHTTA